MDCFQRHRVPVRAEAQQSRFRVYDEGDCALVDRTLLDVNRVAYGGDDRAVALALARRARGALASFAAVDEAGIVEDLRAAAAAEGDGATLGALLGVLRCRRKTLELWSRLATRMEAFVSLEDGAPGGAGSLAEHMERSASGAAAAARGEQGAPPSRGPRGDVGKGAKRTSDRRKARGTGARKGKRGRKK